jgi:AcrR family transcriptional regulator/DNA-binding MarR family transcriptional regulator
MPRKRDHSTPRRGNRVVRGPVRSPSLQPAAARNGRVRVSEMQRSRLLGGAVAAVEELGWSNVTVASIASRARVSRKTFYDLFTDREDCLLAVLRDTQERIVNELVAGDLDGLAWRERVRMGLWTILCFFDREPELARLCVVQSAFGGSDVLAWRLGVLARLTAIVDEGRLERARASEVPHLAAEGTVGAVVAILNLRLLDGEDGSLRGLLGALMGLIVLPYLGSGVVLRERKRAVPVLPASPVSGPGRVYHAGEDPLKDIPMRLTYRTARVLEAVAQHPGASNRTIGELADIPDQGQVSKLLARLQGLGLLTNTAGRDAHTKGAANAWYLTGLGERIVQHLALNTDSDQDGA